MCTFLSASLHFVFLYFKPVLFFFELSPSDLETVYGICLFGPDAEQTSNKLADGPNSVTATGTGVEPDVLTNPNPIKTRQNLFSSHFNATG